MKKGVVALLMLFCIASTLFNSCSKDGAPGMDGVDGENGTKIHSGTGDPASDLGIIGDFYLNLSTSNLFGPKAESGWGLGFPLKAQDGTDGTDGATILNGPSAPSADIGKIGDFYIDTQVLAIYGPKSTTGWGDGVSLRNDEYYGVRAYSISAKFTEYFDNQNYQTTYPKLQMITDSYNLPFLHSSAVLGVYVSVEGSFGMRNSFPHTIYNGDLEDLPQIPYWVDINAIHESYFNFINLSTRVGLSDVRLYYATFGSSGVNDQIRFHFKSDSTYYNPQGEDTYIDINHDFPADSIRLAMHVKYIPQKEYQIISKSHPDVNRFLRIRATGILATEKR